MAQMPQLRTIANKTPADAVDPEYNFDTLENHLANEVINRDGSVAMQAPLVLSGTPTQPNHAVPKSYIDSVIFPGVMWEYGGDTAPEGWALCDGSEQSSTDPTYANLFAVIGYKFGDAGGGNFNLPDFRSAVAVGRDAGVPENDTVGKTGGDADGVAPHVHAVDYTHIHTTVSHTHKQTAHTHGLSHRHTMNHNHGAVTTSSTDVQIRQGPASGSSYGFRTETNQVSATVSGANVSNHTHSVNLPNYSGYTGTESGQTQDGSSNGSTANTTAAAPATEETTLDAGTEETGTLLGNYPPYVVVTKIIKL